MLRALWLRLTASRPLAVSESWLRDQERRSDRVEFVGVRWSWPVNKLKNDAAKWNAARLKRRA